MPVKYVQVSPARSWSFFSEATWPRVLGGKRVTTVGAFKATIMSQWNKREQLFALQTIPDCDLKVVQIPQTQCETDVADQQWRRNLERLNASVEAPEPDAVICAGRVPFGVGRLPR